MCGAGAPPAIALEIDRGHGPRTRMTSLHAAVALCLTHSAQYL